MRPSILTQTKKVLFLSFLAMTSLSLGIADASCRKLITFHGYDGLGLDSTYTWKETPTVYFSFLSHIKETNEIRLSSKIEFSLKHNRTGRTYNVKIKIDDNNLQLGTNRHGEESYVGPLYWEGTVNMNPVEGVHENFYIKNGGDGTITNGFLALFLDLPFDRANPNLDLQPIVREPSCWNAIFGDINEDGSVDSLDAGIMFSNWGAATSETPGNLNGDGVVDGADASLLFANWTN